MLLTGAEDECEPAGRRSLHRPPDREVLLGRDDREVDEVVLEPPLTRHCRVDAVALRVKHRQVLVRRVRLVVEQVKRDAVRRLDAHLQLVRAPSPAGRRRRGARAHERDALVGQRVRVDRIEHDRRVHAGADLRRLRRGAARVIQQAGAAVVVQHRVQQLEERAARLDAGAEVVRDDAAQQAAARERLIVRDAHAGRRVPAHVHRLQLVRVVVDGDGRRVERRRRVEQAGARHRHVQQTAAAGGGQQADT